MTVNAQAAGAAAGTSGRGEGAAPALGAAPAPSASAAFGLAQPTEQEPSWLCTATGGGEGGSSGAAGGGGSGGGAGGGGGNGEGSSDDDSEEFLDLQQARMHASMVGQQSQTGLLVPLGPWVLHMPWLPLACSLTCAGYLSFPIHRSTLRACCSCPTHACAELH